MKTSRLVLPIVLAALAAGAVQAAEPEDIIKYRQSMMKATAGHMGAANGIIRGKVDYQSDLAEHGKAIAALMKNVAGLFPKDSDFGDTEALDAVWKNNAEFKKRAETAKVKSAAFAKAAATGDKAKAGAAFKELNDACKACHKDFRKEEK